MQLPILELLKVSFDLHLYVDESMFNEVELKENKMIQMKLIASVIILCYFSSSNNAIPVISRKFSSIMLPEENECPVSNKYISPAINYSPFLVGSDSMDDKGNRDDTMIVVPISRHLFEKLQLVVLPSREICVLGEKLKKIRLPYDSEFEVMTGVGIWFSPCVSKETHAKRIECFDKKMELVNAADVRLFRNLYDILVVATQTM